MKATYRVDALQLPGEEGSIRVKAGDDDGSVFSIITHHLSHSFVNPVRQMKPNQPNE